MSAIGTPTYKLAKFLVPILEPLTTNEYTIKDSFTFVEELQSFDSKLVMASFDIKSLFTNIPLQETINLCVENLFQDRTHVDNLSKDSFRELLTRTMSESLILFDQEFYKQHDGVAIGSRLGPTLANVFLYYHEKIWLQNCPSEFKPVIYRKYVDDTFLRFRSKHHIEKFRNYLNRQHKNIKFTSETENENSISFLDIKITRDNNKFMTSVTANRPLAESLPTLKVSSRSHINTTCCLPYYTGHLNFAQILNVFIRKLTSLRLFLKITVTPKVLLISVSKST